MIPIAGLSTSARNLVNYWSEARLRADLAKSASVRPSPGIVPWRSALEDILKVGYGVQAQPRFVDGAWEQIRWRTTPSAGALYPFEIVVSVVGEGSYLWDVERDRLVALGAKPLLREALREAGFVTRPGQRIEALVSFIARPWQSMKKYRLRGYQYSHLDVGHTATNLALYTAALGHDPVLHLRFSRPFLVDLLNLGGLCREPFAVLSFASTESSPSGPPDPENGGPPSGLELPSRIEIENWDTLQGILSFDFALEPPSEPASTPLVEEPAERISEAPLFLPERRHPLTVAAEWRSAILGRRSAKGFRPDPIDPAQLGELLGGLRGESLVSDCAERSSGGLGVRLVARNVNGVSGVYSYSPLEHALYRIAEDAADPRPACMQQDLAGDASALLIFHAPLEHRLDVYGYSAFAELQFRAAELGQRLHLASSRLGQFGMTCIGGFDGEECRALAHLPPQDEAIYVILLGMKDDSAFKYDRLGIAFSHGHTTTADGE